MRAGSGSVVLWMVLRGNVTEDVRLSDWEEDLAAAPGAREEEPRLLSAGAATDCGINARRSGVRRARREEHFLGQGKGGPRGA